MKFCVQLFLIFTVLQSQLLMAQNHYWDNQFGANNSLLGGANSAYIKDNAAIYYNPGCMGFIESSKISISANLYKLELLDFKNIGGNGVNTKSLKSIFYPQIIGGNFIVKKIPQLKIFYGVLTRNRSSVRYTLKNEMFTNFIPESAGNEFYKGRVDYNFNSFETWAGIGFGYKVNDKFSVGGSVFGSYLNVENTLELSTSADAFHTDTTTGVSTPYTVSVNEFSNSRIDNVSLIFKIGAVLSLTNFKFGLAITMPSASIWGRGTFSKSFSGNNLNIYSNNEQQVYQHANFLLEDAQSNLRVTYKTVPSFLIGSSFFKNNLTMHISTEFFLGNKDYNVFQGKDIAYIRPAATYGGEIIKGYSTLKSHAVPVVNVAIGASYKIKNKYKFLASFRTDFDNKINFLSPTNFNNSSFVRVPQWHLLHFAAGASYYKGANDISLGVTYAFGFRTDKRQMINIAQPDINNFLRGNIQNNAVTLANAIGLVIGYTYYIKSNPRSTESDVEKRLDW